MIDCTDHDILQVFLHERKLFLMKIYFQSVSIQVELCGHEMIKVTKGNSRLYVKYDVHQTKFSDCDFQIHVEIVVSLSMLVIVGCSLHFCFQVLSA